VHDRGAIAVIGSGFAGSLMAMMARRLGYNVVLIERARHPRFAIGESSTPLANLLLERIAKQYNLPQLLPFTKWGSWQREHPEVACGLKRGFAFFHHEFGASAARICDPAHQLLVAASPHNAIADTHWFRADFDAFLVREAQKLGVVLCDQFAAEKFGTDAGGATLEGVRHGQHTVVHAQFVIDASGPRGFLHRARGLPEASPTCMPKTEVLFTHFTGVSRLDDLHAPLRASETPLPFPVDDAAVHHLFAGGWIWVLRFNNGITSAGVAATQERAAELRFADGADAWHRLLERLPAVRAQFFTATPVREFVHVRSPGFRSDRVTGPHWALLPSAAGFVDPLLSTGFPLTLLGIERVGRALAHPIGSTAFTNALADYAQQTIAELSMTEELVAALYATMHDFPLFRALSLLYFAAASFGETVVRLDSARRASENISFLLRDRREFADAMHEICLAAHATLRRSAARDALIDKIRRVIAPIDVAGFSDCARQHWFPVKRDDLLRAAAKVDATPARLATLLDQMGF
jgi:FADH2 O2-dependent halogenase